MSAFDTFKYLSVTFAMILGLGVTRVLSGMIAVFRSRQTTTIDWIPLAWAGATFVLQIQYWWAVIELPTRIDRWTLTSFLVLLAVPLVLFAASALLLPGNELRGGHILSEEFERDGRWGLVCLSIYGALALIIDLVLFRTDLRSTTTLFLGIEFVLPIAFLLSDVRRFRAVITVGYLITVLWSSWQLSPEYY
jgi:hypothetical protein